MGAVLRKSFGFIFLFFILSIFCFSGCGDIYKNMKIIVDSDNSITLYLKAAGVESLGAQDNDKEPYYKELSVTIDGVKDKNISKNLEVVFDNPKIASAGEFEYDGNNAKIKIYAAYPGTTMMYIKSSDNTSISSEGIEINVIEPVSQIIVEDVKCAVAKGTTIDLRKIDGIKFLPITSNEADLEFCFKDGKDIDAKYGLIKDKHLLTVYNNNEVKLGLVDIMVKSPRDDVESKTFSILIYNDFSSSDIKVKDGTNALTCYNLSEYGEEILSEGDDLTIISNFVNEGAESVERTLNLSVDAENDYEYEILNEGPSNQGIVSIDKKFNENGEAILGQFLLTPIKEGSTYLKVKTYLVCGGVRYLEKDVYIKVDIRTIVKSAYIKVEDFTTIDDQNNETLSFSIDEEENKFNLDIFEISKYGGTVFDVVEINPTHVVNDQFRLLLDSGVDNKGNEISVDKFAKYIRVYVGKDNNKLLASFSTYNESEEIYYGTRFNVNEKIYIAYDDDLLTDEETKNLASFNFKILFNYEQGLVPFEITVNCRVFQSVLNLKLSDDSDKDVNIERNKVCILKLTASTNIYLDLFKVTSNNENAVKIISYYHPEKDDGSALDDLNAICVQFQTFNVGRATISLIEKSTLKIVSININVVNLNDENLTYLQILDNFEIGKIEYVYTEASVFDENLTYYRKDSDSYMAVDINEVNAENVSSFFIRNTEGFVVYVQSGASFEAALKTSTNATIELSYKVVDVNNEGGTIYKNLVDKRIEYDADSKTLTFATYSNNEVSNIENENTFEQISIDIKYYAIDEGKIEEKHKIITIKVATYKKLSGFGENLNNRDFEIYDNDYLSIFNQSNDVGVKSFIPTIGKTTNSGLKYELKYDLRIGDETNYQIYDIAGALLNGWIVEEILSEEEELLGLKVKPQTSAEITELKKLIVHFSVEEFDITYHAWFNVECITPTLFTSLSLDVNEMYIENFEASNYSSSEIKIKSFSPFDVFDKNLTYIVYSQQDTTINCLAVFDENVNSVTQRYNNNSPIIFEKEYGIVYAKYNKDKSISNDVNYYIKVLPSYLVNKEYGKDDFSEYGGYEGYIKNILDYASLMNSIEINFVDGTEDNPYQIKNQNDLEKMFASGKTNSYFALMNDIKLSADWNNENKLDLNYNLISNPYSKVTGVTGDNYKNYYTKTLNYVPASAFDETQTYYTESSGVYTVETGVTQNNFQNYYILQYYKKVGDNDSYDNSISYYSKNGKYSISGLKTNFVKEIKSGATIQNVNFYYDSIEINLSGNFGMIARENSGLIKNVMLNPQKNSDIITINGCSNFGGLCGVNNGVIQNCYGTINVLLDLINYNGDSGFVGGFIGQNNGRITTQSNLVTSYKSNIKIKTNVIKEHIKIGGLVGQNSSTGHILGVLQDENNNIVGTSIDVESNINAPNCDNVGGVCGENLGEIARITVAPRIKAHSYVGGAVGNSSDEGNLSYVLCEFYNDGSSERTSIYGEDYVGGLVGKFIGPENRTSSIINCYVTSYYQNYELVLYGESLQGGNKFYGDICAKDYVGGLVGYANRIAINKSFANVSVGLKSKFVNASSFIEGETYYSYDAQTGSYNVATDVNSENVTSYYIIANDNVAGGFVGYLGDYGSNNITNCYAIVNMTNISNNIGQFVGQFVYNGLSTGFINFSYAVFNKGNAFDTPFANMDRESYCTKCYYQDNSIEQDSTDSSDYLNARKQSEMQTMGGYSYAGWSGSDWTIIEGYNNKYPIIVDSSLRLYNTSIGQIVIDEFKSDSNNEEKPLPKFIRYEDGKIIIFLDQLNNNKIALGDLIGINSISNYSGLKLSADNNNVEFEIGSEDSLDRFILKFNSTGLTKITISSAKNSAVLTTFQIFIIGGFTSFNLEDEAEDEDTTIYVQKDGSNTEYVYFEQNSSQSYEDNLGVQLTTESENLINVNNLTWNDKVIYYDFSTSNSIIFFGNLNVNESTFITLTPYVIVSFYDQSNQRVDYKLLLNESIKAYINTQTLNVIVYQGVTNLYLNEMETQTENRFKLEVVLNIESDNIDDFNENELQIYQYRIVEEPAGDNIYVRNNDGSYAKVTSFDDDVVYYEKIKWEVNKNQRCLEYGGEIIYYTSTRELLNGVAGIYKMNFYVSHKPYQRMTESEIENWYFYVDNKDRTRKEDELVINWIPTEVHAIDIIHFLDLEMFVEDYDELGYEDGTDTISSGSFGMLKISVTESYSDFDYIEVRGYSNNETISFNRYIVNNEGKLVFDYNNSDYSQHINNVLRLFNDQNANGVFYVSTLISVGIPENTEFTVEVKVYKNGIVEDAFRQTKTLYSVFAPYVKMEIVENYARLTDGGIIAKGTKLNLNVKGVLQDSYVSVSVDGCEGVYINTDGTIVNQNEMLNSPKTEQNYNETISIYAGVNASITSVDGYMTITATVKSYNVITYYVLKLYLVDYLIQSISVENVVYNYYYLDGNEYIKATKYNSGTTYYTRSGVEGNYVYTAVAGVNAETFKPIYSINIQEGYKPLRLVFQTQFGEFYADSDQYVNIENARNLAASFGFGNEFDENDYKEITNRIINKIKELNAFGTISGDVTIWKYAGNNIDVDGQYSYFFLNVDNDTLTIRGRAETEILFSVNLNRGYKLNGDCYELLLQNDSILEDYLQVSSGDYFSDFAIQFINDSDKELPIPVGTVDEFKQMAENGHYILTADLNLGDWTPLSTKIGSLDGNGYRLTIESFNVSQNVNNIGLFETISTYTNLKNAQEPTRLTNVVIEIKDDIIINLEERTSANFGFLVGENNGGIIYNCEVISTQEFSNNAETLDYNELSDDINDIVEELTNTTKIIITSQASSSAGINIGGLVGRNSGFITNSRFGRLDDVLTEENKNRSGVDEDNNGIVDNLVAMSGFTIVGIGKIGGLVANNSGVISASYFANSDLINASNVTSADDSNILTGGLVAINSGRINTSYVESEAQKGPNDSLNSNGFAIEDNVEYYKDGEQIFFVRRNKNKIYSGASVGGFVNTNSGIIENCFANICLDSVFVGGFVYSNTEGANINYSYSVCAIANEKSNNGVFVGIDKERNINNAGTVYDCYYLIDSAMFESLVDPAVGLTRQLLCGQKEKTLGFVFGNDNKGIWYLNLDDEFGFNDVFKTPSLIEANNIAYSRREVIFDEADNILVYNNTNFGVKENPMIVYNPKSFSNISITDASEKDSFSYTRIVADVDFNQNTSQIKTLYGDVASSTLKYMGNMQANGMTFKNINLTVETNAVEDSDSIKYFGFFAEIENAVISNLTLDIKLFTATATDVVGGLCGHLNNSYINNIKVLSSSSVAVIGKHIIGGIVGYAEGEYSNLSNLTSSISVESSYDVAAGNPGENPVAKRAENINLWSDSLVTKDYIENQSYAGGIAGVLSLGDEVKTYDEPKVVNCKVMGNFLIKAVIVGGLFGCVNDKTAISHCRLILNENPSDQQELQAGLLAGGLVGDNRGLIIYSYISLDDDVQAASDKAFSVNKNVNSQIGTHNLFTERCEAIGGLVGLNIGCESMTDDLSGGIEYSYSRVNVQNENSSIAGGLIGIATYFRSQHLSDILGSKKIYTVDNGNLSDDLGNLWQSGFLYGVYTTGQVMANECVGGLVGWANAVINVLKTTESDKGHIAIFPGSIQLAQNSSNGNVGYVIGNPYYESNNIHFIQLGGQKAIGAISTINLSSNIKLVGGVENSVFLSEGSNCQFVNELNAQNLADFVWISQSMETAFKAFGVSDTDVIWDYDEMQEDFIFPRLSVGNVKQVNIIKNAEDYITYVKSNARGRYSIQCDYDEHDDIIPIEFDFTSNTSIEVAGESKTLKEWFEFLYSDYGPSGVMVGYTQKGDMAVINIKTDSSNLMPFFGANINSLTLSNIKFNIESTDNITTKEAGQNDLYWGMLSNYAKSCIFENVCVKFTKQYNLDKYKAIGGLVGSSEKSIYENVEVNGIFIKNQSYTIKDDITRSLFVGGIVGQSSSDTFSNIKLTNSEIDIKTTANEENSIVSIGGIVGYAYGNYFKLSGFSYDSTLTFDSTNDIKTIYVGGVVGYVNCAGQKSIINSSYNKNVDIQVLSDAENSYVGGVVGYSNVTSISDIFVEGNIATKNAKNSYIGGIVGSYNTTINNIRSMPYTKLATNLERNVVNISIDVQNSVLNSNNYVGGVAGIINLNAKVTIPEVNNYINVIKDNETTGEISVKSQKQGQIVYVGGLFGRVCILLKDIHSQAENKLAINNSQNAIDITVYDAQKAYIGGICGYSDLNIINAINYGLLLNDLSDDNEVLESSCLSYIGGIVAQTTQSLDSCLSLGAIFEPDFVEYYDIETETTIQNSFAQALAADIWGVIKNSFYSSDFTGVLQYDYESKYNIQASNLTETKFSNFTKAYIDGDVLKLPRIVDLNTEKSVAIKTLLDILADRNDKFTTYILAEDAEVFETKILSEKGNIQIVGFGHTIITNGCPLFDVVPKTVMISGIQVLSSKDILAESDFGLLAITNEGIITNCIAGALPQYREVEVEAGKQPIATLGEGLSDRQFGQSESNGGILTIYVNNSNINVGALVGVNKKIINNCWSYADIKIEDYKKLTTFDNNTTYYEKEYVSDHYDYNEVEATSENFMNYYILEEFYERPAQYEDVLYYELTSTYTEVESSAVDESNFMNYYVLSDGNYIVLSEYVLGQTYYEKNEGYSLVDEPVDSSNFYNYYVRRQKYVKPLTYDSEQTYYEKEYVSGYYQYSEVTATSENYTDYYVVNTATNCSVGVLVGNNKHKLSHSYSMGKLDILLNEANHVGGVVGDNISASVNYVRELISYVDVYSSGLSVGTVVYNNSNSQMLHVYDLSRTTDKFIASQVLTKSTIEIYNTDTQLFNSDFFKKDNKYNYGYYYLALNNSKSLTSNNEIYYIENFVELNLLSVVNNNVTYVFVRDLNAKPLSVNSINTNRFNINGNGYYIFSDSLLSYGNTYTLFNIELNKNSKLENILYNFGYSKINSSADYLRVAPLIAIVNGGQVLNCAVYGIIDIDKDLNNSLSNLNGVFGGLVAELYSGDVLYSFSKVDITISNVNSFIVGGLVGKMGKATLQYCFTAGNIHLKSTQSLNTPEVYIGGLVGELNANNATIKYCYFAGEDKFGKIGIRTDVYEHVYLGEFIGKFDQTLSASTPKFIEYCLFEGNFIEDKKTKCTFICNDGYINKLKLGDNEISSLIAFGYVRSVDIADDMILPNNYASFMKIGGVGVGNYFLTNIVDQTTLTSNQFAQYIICDDENWTNIYYFTSDGTRNLFPYLERVTPINIISNTINI